jgi:hypothetical protein
MFVHIVHRAQFAPRRILPPVDRVPPRSYRSLPGLRVPAGIAGAPPGTLSPEVPRPGLTPPVVKTVGFKRGEESEHYCPTTQRGVQGRRESLDDLGGLLPREAQGQRGEHDHEGPKHQIDRWATITAPGGFTRGPAPCRPNDSREEYRRNPSEFFSIGA